MLDRPPSPELTPRAKGAQRWRRWKARHKRGRILVKVEVDDHAVAQALINSRRLSETETQRRELVERALAEVIADWATRWR
jgi:hypothetical protein